MSEYKISEIKPQKKPGLYSIITGDGFEFSLTAKGIYENGVRVGAVFSEAEFEKIRDYAALESSYRYAVYLLGVRDMSSGELEKKLLDKGKCAAPVIERLTAQGYINDEAYAKKIIKKYIASYGKKRVEQELFKRKIPKELWSDELDSVCCDSSETLLELLAKRMKHRPFADRAERDRVYAYFIRRGFGYEEVTAAIREYNNKVEFDD